MKLVSLAAMGACLLFVPPPVDAQADATDQEKLQGKWTVESFQYNGMPVDALKDAVREFNGDKYSLKLTSGEEFSGTTKIDAAAKPKQIDLQLSDRTLKGIYEIDGDTLKISYVLDGDQRPTELASKPDSGVVLAIHKRMK